MTKAELVEEIYQELGFSKKVSAEIVEKVLETLKETLARGEPVKISGFGRFVVRGKRARKARRAGIVRRDEMSNDECRSSFAEATEDKMSNDERQVSMPAHDLMKLSKWSECLPVILGSELATSRCFSSGMTRRVAPCVPPLKVRSLP